MLGLSPRVRGNLAATRSRGCSYWVYPRVCGGTDGKDLFRLHEKGLSPRVRGNPGSVQGILPHRRSIPACAGEPARPRRRGLGVGVYPRVCGGTAVRIACGNCGWGLSPRVRGNRLAIGAAFIVLRSIPACAGEPPGPGRRAATGGRGLSPRVRGNRPVSRPLPAGTWSIPACAGEPSIATISRYVQRVYPRVCGGTQGRFSAAERGNGLSPRVRGNRILAAKRQYGAGSIPACAGEP